MGPAVGETAFSLFVYVLHAPNTGFESLSSSYDLGSLEADDTKHHILIPWITDLIPWITDVLRRYRFQPQTSQILALDINSLSRTLVILDP